MSISLNIDALNPEEDSIALLKKHYPEVTELSGEGWGLDKAFNISANGKDKAGKPVKVALNKINAEVVL